MTFFTFWEKGINLDWACQIEYQSYLLCFLGPVYPLISEQPSGLGQAKDHMNLGYISTKTSLYSLQLFYVINRLFHSGSLTDIKM